MANKIDKILEECWNLKSDDFGQVSLALDRLLEALVGCANARGVPYKVAWDTYLDWIRSHMETASFWA